MRNKQIDVKLTVSIERPLYYHISYNNIAKRLNFLPISEEDIDGFFVTDGDNRFWLSCEEFSKKYNFNPLEYDENI